MQHAPISSSAASRRCRLLRRGLLVQDHVDVCRGAAVAFMWCSHSWGKRELATWLIGPYTRSAGPLQARSEQEGAPASGVMPVVPNAAKARPQLGPPRMVSDEAIRRLLRRTRKHLVAFLRTVPIWKYEVGFSRRMLDSGLVVGMIDGEGGLGYTPVASSNMRLLDRVKSLYVADYLTRPDDYSRFRICDGCDGPTFDLHNEHGETCGIPIDDAAIIAA